jgi:hypothetical protein
MKIMKKKYINPTMEVVEIQIQQSILTASVPIDSTGLDGSNAAAPEYDFEEQF